MEENNLKKFIKMAFLIGTPSGCMFSAFFFIFIVVALVLGIFNGNGGSSGEVCISIKSVDHICEKMIVNGESMSVDEYVAGVTYREFEGASGYENTLKAQAIAARSYGLAGAKKDGNGNCVIDNTTEGFQTFSEQYPDEFLRIAEETSGMVMVDENGNVASTMYSSNSLSEPYSTYGDKVKMYERDLWIPRDWWEKNKTCSDAKLNSLNTGSGYTDVYGCGHGRGMGQIAAWYLDREEGYDYMKILDFFYGKESGYNYSLASTNGATSHCTSSYNGTLPELDEYNLCKTAPNSDGSKKLKLLNHTLSDNDVKVLNEYIDSQIAKAGRGTGAAVAAAGQSLVYGLSGMGYYLGYYWGGGHSGFGDRNSSFIGVNPNWGSSRYGISYTDNGNPTGPELGMDCSGFVSWATRTACKSSFGSKVSGDWLYLSSDVKYLSSLKNAKPGDVITNSGHIQLIVKNNGDGTVIVAESGGKCGDLNFNVVNDALVKANSRKIVDMSKWYANNCENISEPIDNTPISSNLKTLVNDYLSKNGATGDWAVYVKNLKNNKVDVNINGSSKMIAASEIKLYIMAYLYNGINTGDVKASDSLSKKINKMITESDNDATNDLIDEYGMKAINKYISNNNYLQTKLNRKMLTAGEENYTSAENIATLLEKIYNNKLVSKDYSEKMLNLLKNQTRVSKIPAGVPNGVVTANKTGELSNVENDAAIIYSDAADYIIVVLSDDLKDTDKAKTNIKKISSIVYEYYN